MVWLNLSYIAYSESYLEKTPSSSSQHCRVERYLDLNLVLVLGVVYLLYIAFTTRVKTDNIFSENAMDVTFFCATLIYRIERT